MKEIEDAVEMINDMHNGRHYLDESVKSVITNLYSLKTLQQPKSCESCKYEHEDAYSLPCAACVRNCDRDYYEPKEQRDESIRNVI